MALVATACAGGSVSTDSPVAAGAQGSGTDDTQPGYDAAPSWALHPETLFGSKRFRELTHRGKPTPGERPNIVLISTDDQNDDEMAWMPKTRALLGSAGTRFSDSVSPHPLCCPARAEILSGQFAQNNGVRSNFWPSGGYYALDSENTLPVWLKQAGYQTAFVGKYLNEYGMLNRTEVPPGWDHWRAPVPRGAYDYYRYTMNENGELEPPHGEYITDYDAEHTEDLIAQMSAEDRPFFLWQSNLAPHTACPLSKAEPPCWDQPTPSVRYDRMYDDVPQPQRANPAFNEADVGDKPRQMAARPLLGPIGRQHLTELYQRRIESLQSVDDSVARTVAALDEAGELDDTLIIFTSDNGYVLGEHRYQGKVLGYEPALQVPLLMRGPSVPVEERSTQTVATTDLAPTIAAAAGVDPGRRVDGRNLLPVAQGRAKGWDTILVQGGPRSPDSDLTWLYRGVRTRRYTYMEYERTGEAELYDRDVDPNQLQNVAGDPAYAAAQTELRQRLDRLDGCAGARCRERFGPVPGPQGEPTR